MEGLTSVEIETIGSFGKHVTEQMFNEFMDKTIKSKDDILRQRIKDLGLNLDIEKESRKRFKSFYIEHQGDKETYWFNDGSESGLRIITFITEIGKPQMQDGAYKMIAETKYY